MRWSEAGYLSRIVLTHAPRQASVSLILGVRHTEQNDCPRPTPTNAYWRRRAEARLLRPADEKNEPHTTAGHRDGSGAKRRPHRLSGTKAHDPGRF